jgi:hypothetical protein
MAEICEVDVQGAVKNHCPCGCTLDDLAAWSAEQTGVMLGYCRHLQGFTNDGKTFEPITQRYHKTADGESEPVLDTIIVRRAYKGKSMTEPVLKSDVLVNPVEEQFVRGIRYLAKKWVSSRVYRRTETDNVAKPVATSTDLAELIKENHELRRQSFKEMQELRDEIAALRAERDQDSQE